MHLFSAMNATLIISKFSIFLVKSRKKCWHSPAKIMEVSNHDFGLNILKFRKLPLYIHESKYTINADVYIEILEKYVQPLANLIF